jgi:hypothetical protein
VSCGAEQARLQRALKSVIDSEGNDECSYPSRDSNDRNDGNYGNYSLFSLSSQVTKSDHPFEAGHLRSEIAQPLDQTYVAFRA